MDFRITVSNLFLQSLRAIINPSDEPPLLRLVHPCDTSPAQMLHELGQRDPSRGVHVLVVLVLNELLVHGVRLDAFRTESIDGMSNSQVEKEGGRRTSVRAK